MAPSTVTRHLMSLTGRLPHHAKVGLDPDVWTTNPRSALGLDYRLAWVVAGACEALYMYAAMRWLVFRDVQRPTGTRRSAWQERRSAR